MELLIQIALFVAGIAALLIGGNALVKGASTLAKILGISPVVIGLTIVAFGTSAPEFLVCLIAVLKGSGDIALGNILGSNISNIGLILGFSAIISSLVIHMKLVKVEVPVMILLSVLLLVLSLNHVIGRLEGLVLFIALVGFSLYSYYDAKREPREVEREFEEYLGAGNGTLKQVLYIVLGLVGLVIGARLVVDGAIYVARVVGVSELIISITAVAIGTSLPELTTSIIAALKKEPDIIIGNIIGSNIFNIGILGLVAMIRPVEVNPGLITFEFPVMLAFSILVLPMMRTGFRISRLEGVLLLLGYSAFIFLLFF